MPNSPIGKGIEYITTGTVYAVRVVVRQAGAFIIGPIAGEGKNAAKARSLASIKNEIKDGKYNLRPVINGSRIELYPIWVSNGTFFDPGGKYMDSYGAIVENGSGYKSLLTKPRIASAPPSIVKSGKQKRWIYLHNLYANGKIENRFYHLQTNTLASDIQDGSAPTPFPKPELSPTAKNGWDWAIGGAGSLIQNSQKLSESAWSSRSQGSFNIYDQIPKASPIIAMNDKDNDPVIYLIMPRANSGWSDMASYLTDRFLKEIKHEGDGRIRDALVYDGGSSKQLWVRGEGVLPLASRLVPNFICLWGRKPAK